MWNFLAYDLSAALRNIRRRDRTLYVSPPLEPKRAKIPTPRPFRPYRKDHG
jgi:hypothetical protein